MGHGVNLGWDWLFVHGTCKCVKCEVGMKRLCAEFRANTKAAAFCEERLLEAYQKLRAATKEDEK